MRLTEFHQLLEDEFGGSRARFIIHSHVLAAHGQTVEDLIEQGVDLRKIWWGLCEDFDVPEERRLGRDDPGH